MARQNSDKHKRKMLEKKKKKAERAMQYAAQAAAGKSKKSSIRGKKKGRAHNHPIKPCGNPGCRACYTIKIEVF